MGDLGSYEIHFSKPIDIKQKTKEYKGGVGGLWLTCTESQEDFKRLRGVDLITWNRVLIDLSSEYAYICIPGKDDVKLIRQIAEILDKKYKIYKDGAEIKWTKNSLQNL